MMDLKTGTEKQTLSGSMVDKYYDRIYPVVYRMVANEEIAKDLTQDVFLKAWENREKFRGDSDPGTWLYRIGVNVTLTWLDKQKRTQPTSLEETCLPDNKPGAQSKLEKHDDHIAVRNAVSSLSPKFKLVLIMHYYEDMKIDQIADILKISRGTVAWRLFRARKLIEKQLLRSGIVF
jgi:RNA polymerase sigma-70 factor (ECF subfamily)